MSEYRMKEILDEAHQQRERAERAEAMTDALRGRVISDADSARRVYAGLIAAAPTDGRGP